jgi:hypothetical protein
MGRDAKSLTPGPKNGRNARSRNGKAEECAMAL